MQNTLFVYIQREYAVVDEFLGRFVPARRRTRELYEVLSRKDAVDADGKVTFGMNYNF